MRCRRVAQGSERGKAPSHRNETTVGLSTAPSLSEPAWTRSSKWHDCLPHSRAGLVETRRGRCGKTYPPYRPHFVEGSTDTQRPPRWPSQSLMGSQRCYCKCYALCLMPWWSARFAETWPCSVQGPLHYVPHAPHYNSTHSAHLNLAIGHRW